MLKNPYSPPDRLVDNDILDDTTSDTPPPLPVVAVVVGPAGMDAECSMEGRDDTLLNGLVSSLREGILSHDGIPTLQLLLVVLSRVGEDVRSLPNIEPEADGG